MKTQNWLENLLTEFQHDPEYHLEKLRLEIMEQMLALMESAGITRAEMARKLGCSNAYITKLLNGSENLTLLKLAQIATVLHSTIDVTFVPQSLTVTKVFQMKKVEAKPREFTHTIHIGAKHGVDFPVAA